LSKHRDVGRSWRTHAKHELMSSVVGQEVGVAVKLDVDRLVWIDLTAGDAAPVDGEKWNRSCSPGILAHHAAHSRKPVEIVLHEIQPATFDRLCGNLERFLPDLGYEKDGDSVWRLDGSVSITAINASGHDADVAFISNRDAVFVLNDPNAITEWAMRPTFAREIVDRTWCFRSLSTMGCNPAGIKRLPFEERQAWFDMIGTQQNTLPHYRDLLLAAIERDEAQWAYLLCTSAKWRTTSENVVSTAFRRTGRTAAMTWFGVDPLGFEETKRFLFLTKKERDAL
jgi:hypothetical protein